MNTKELEEIMKSQAASTGVPFKDFKILVLTSGVMLFETGELRAFPSSEIVKTLDKYKKLSI